MERQSVKVVQRVVSASCGWQEQKSCDHFQVFMQCAKTLLVLLYRSFILHFQNQMFLSWRAGCGPARYGPSGCFESHVVPMGSIQEKCEELFLGTRLEFWGSCQSRSSSEAMGNAVAAELASPQKRMSRKVPTIRKWAGSDPALQAEEHSDEGCLAIQSA